MGGSKTAKFVNVFSLESFPLLRSIQYFLHIMLVCAWGGTVIPQSIQYHAFGAPTRSPIKYYTPYLNILLTQSLSCAHTQGIKSNNARSIGFRAISE